MENLRGLAMCPIGLATSFIHWHLSPPSPISETLILILRMMKFTDKVTVVLRAGT